jgi:heme/copper-type cytochrome/quinol oxidase subunit 2
MSHDENPYESPQTSATKMPTDTVHPIGTAIVAFLMSAWFCPFHPKAGNVAVPSIRLAFTNWLLAAVVLGVVVGVGLGLLHWRIRRSISPRLHRILGYAFIMIAALLVPFLGLFVSPQ